MAFWGCRFLISWALETAEMDIEVPLLDTAAIDLLVDRSWVNFGCCIASPPSWFIVGKFSCISWRLFFVFRLFRAFLLGWSGFGDVANLFVDLSCLAFATGILGGVRYLPGWDRKPPFQLFRCGFIWWLICCSGSRPSFLNVGNPTISSHHSGSSTRNTRTSSRNSRSWPAASITFNLINPVSRAKYVFLFINAIFTVFLTGRVCLNSLLWCCNDPTVVPLPLSRTPWIVVHKSWGFFTCSVARGSTFPTANLFTW